MTALVDIQIRDPFVLVDEGVTYVYGSTDKNIWRTGTGFDVYRSTDGLDEFEGPFPAFRPGPDFFSHLNYWAPEVYRTGDTYTMFATFKPDAGRRGTAVLRATSPLGPFEPTSRAPITPPEWECLDGTLFFEASSEGGNQEEPSGPGGEAASGESQEAPPEAGNHEGDPDQDGSSSEGRPWMIFCHEWQQVGDGEICAMPLTDDLTAPVGEPRLLFTASEAPWSVPMPDRAPGSYVTDGPFPWRTADGRLLLLWSSMTGDGHTYALGIATSESGTLAGPWRQAVRPLYESDGGHGMIFRDLTGQLRLALHRPNNTPNERAQFIPLEETKDGLRIAN
ncbi:MAG: glycoside hydrolase family 43 protein [Propionibacteriaceae bacterium]|nr:glycoside hydrolase family 43 protein [Propionibacteriaceae bacterium]